ncbi:MAG: helix-turn-helix domain-containing protein [Candidatus Micrarchaeota archaeon]
MLKVEKCPIENTLGYIGKKWTLNIIRDLFLGKKRFRDFLKANPELSTKMLSARLREMEGNGLLEKSITSTSPVIAEYRLTEKGKGLCGVLHALAMYSIDHHTCQVCGNCDCSKEELKEFAKKAFH